MPAERWWSRPAARKALLLLAIALLWEGYGRWLGNDLLFPTLLQTLQSWFQGLASGELLRRSGNSLWVLLQGYALGIALAMLLAAFAAGTRLGADLLDMLTAVFNPLPAIALLPLALMWFGLGNGSLVFVLVHSVMWPMALNAHSGFRAVSPTLRMVGQNVGLRGLRYTVAILVPAAFPSLLAGLKIGWAFAWRTLIAAELVFGVSSGSGGLGWFIYERKNQLDTGSVFAGLLTVILIGLLVEGLLFRWIENRTVRRWGMQSG
ncbi:MAG TPA: ABC transporter permease subunit [Pseudorhodoferax sp.]|nr:ABC transporter permease subunit [Pseudorhodoferax sp.]